MDTLIRVSNATSLASKRPVHRDLVLYQHGKCVALFDLRGEPGIVSPEIGYEYGITRVSYGPVVPTTLRLGAAERDRITN